MARYELPEVEGHEAKCDARGGGLSFAVCSCGFRREIRHKNALARASRVKSVLFTHLKSVQEK